MSRCCVVALQRTLCNNRPGSKQGKEGGYEGCSWMGGGGHRRDMGRVWHIHIHRGAYTCLYASVSLCVCVRVCATGLVGYQGNGCVGPIRESPAGGEALEMVPWQPTGQGGVCICATLALDWIMDVVDGG